MFSFKVCDLPYYDGRKSFYGKAKVIEDDKRISLKSYNTIVCYIDKQSKKLGKLCDISTVSCSLTDIHNTKVKSGGIV